VLVSNGVRVCVDVAVSVLVTVGVSVDVSVGVALGGVPASTTVNEKKSSLHSSPLKPHRTASYSPVELPSLIGYVKSASNSLFSIAQPVSVSQCLEWSETTMRK